MGTALFYVCIIRYKQITRISVLFNNGTACPIIFFESLFSRLLERDLSFGLLSIVEREERGGASEERRREHGSNLATPKQRKS